MARVLLVIMMVCACFCVTGCKKKEPTAADIEKDAVKKANTATKEAEGTLSTMEDLQ